MTWFRTGFNYLSVHQGFDDNTEQVNHKNICVNKGIYMVTEYLWNIKLWHQRIDYNSAFFPTMNLRYAGLLDII